MKALLAVCAALLSASVSADAGLRFQQASGVAIPQADELKAKVAATTRRPSGATVHAQQGGQLRPAVPRPLQELEAVVQSFDEKDGKARVELSFPGYRSPIVQFWRFDAGSWTESGIEPRALVR
jgi:hypothetical protein